MARIASACALALLGAGLAAPGASASPVRVTSTTTVQHRLYPFPIGHSRVGEEEAYQLVLERFNLTGSVDDFTSHVRFDGMTFFDPPDLEGRGRFEDDARLERITVGYRVDLGSAGALQITAGDAYRQLGRGILLSLRKEDEIGLDIALRGGQVALAGDQLDASAFAGRVNPVNIDIVSEKFAEGADDFVAGAEVKLRELGPVQVATHGVYLGVVPDADRGPAHEDRTVGAGMTLTVTDLGGVGSVFLEGDWQQQRVVVEVPGIGPSETTTDGYAGYGLVELYLADLAVTVEGLYLADMGLRGSQDNVLNTPFTYNQPPTLERIDQEVLNNANVLGGRLRLDYSMLDGDLTVYGNGMYRQTDPGEPAEVSQIHAFGGVDAYYDDGSSRVTASGGWRDEQQTGLPDVADLKSMVHVEADWLHAFDGWSLNLGTINEFRSALGQPDHARGDTLVSLEFTRVGWMQGLGQQLAVTFDWGYDTQARPDKRREHYFAGIVDWSLDERLRTRATFGTQRGGLKCVGGQCRIFPEFAGAKVELITTFDL